MKEQISGSWIASGLSSQEVKNIHHFYKVLNLINKNIYTFLSDPKHFHMRFDSYTHQTIDSLARANNEINFPKTVQNEIIFLEELDLIYQEVPSASEKRDYLLLAWPHLEAILTERDEKWFSIWLDEFDHANILWGDLPPSVKENSIHRHLRIRAHSVWTAIQSKRASKIAGIDYQLAVRALASGVHSTTARHQAELLIDLLSQVVRQPKQVVNLIPRNEVLPLSPDPRDAWGNYEDSWKNTKPR